VLRRLVFANHPAERKGALAGSTQAGAGPNGSTVSPPIQYTTTMVALA
jgi:hypothetical protein